MQCRDARELLDSFLAEQLLVETNHELLRHLSSCPECSAEHDARVRIRGGLKQAFARAGDLQVRPEFAQEVTARLRATALTKAPQWPSRWLAVAASLLIVAAGGVFFLRGRTPGVERQAAGDHQNCAVKYALAEKPIPLSEAADRYDPAYARLQTTPPDEVRTGAGTLHVADRHSCVFDRRRFGHVVFKLDDHLVSVLMTKDDSAGASLPAESQQLSWLPQADGLSIASFHTPGHIVYIVSDLKDSAFRAVAQSLVESRLAVLRTVHRGVQD